MFLHPKSPNVWESSSFLSVAPVSGTWCRLNREPDPTPSILKAELHMSSCVSFSMVDSSSGFAENEKRIKWWIARGRQRCEHPSRAPQLLFLTICPGQNGAKFMKYHFILNNSCWKHHQGMWWWSEGAGLWDGTSRNMHPLEKNTSQKLPCSVRMKFCSRLNVQVSAQAICCFLWLKSPQTAINGPLSMMPICSPEAPGNLLLQAAATPGISMAGGGPLLTCLHVSAGAPTAGLRPH